MLTLDQIAEALGRPVLGDGAVEISGAAEPSEAGPRDIALAMSPAYAAGLSAGRARAAILWEGADWEAMGLEAAVTVPRARLAMATVTRALDEGPEIEPGIHPTAVVHPTASIGADPRIGPFVTVGRDAVIGDRARIMARVSVDAGAAVGDDALLMTSAVISHRVRIGHRFVGQAGCVVGGDGLSFVTPEESTVERARRSLGGDARAPVAQGWTRIHSLGTVEIGDDVEVGCNSTIDRGTVASTVIGRGTKIDNLVHVGHNVRIGEDCLLCGCVGVAGSARIGSRVVLAGQVGVADNIEIGDDVVTGAGTLIVTRVPAGKVLWGSPALEMKTRISLDKHVRRLPRLAAQVAALRAAAAGEATGD
ncbi:UDP-3-O-(3-hydroxymyristoyl)glucosamine N-acyltransferase [Jannaschia sp. Os4]|uniref:UDP-3-O-(3-hydroxymyristoyl)glucosamine N-acyltransferase n=1 Tax=Jannaschia sp. Os4 TaxID=2807617 RepID=UPI00193A3B0A|nr:UDP-3-O-(3-hydroxymyristoyl)glucosamine N-acyltransferase [Jannaschia sp. Os4]MBM2577029.1 UDP-3-O-(3-hydroxymyristoyl)glucosamine N-acyltransferase [Jannaschia sp. Os4]